LRGGATGQSSPCPWRAKELSRFFESQLDCIFLIYGLGFITLGWMALFGLPKTGARLPWRWLGLFGVVHGINEWLDMLALSLPDPPAFRAVRLAVMAVSFLALVEFGRRSLRTYGRRFPGIWVYLPLLALAGMGGFAGMSGLNAACRYALGFPGSMLAAAAVWQASRACVGRERSGLRLVAFSMLVYGPATGLIVPTAAFFPANWLNHASFFATAGFPIQLIRGTCALLMACAVWRFGQAAQSRSLGVPVEGVRGRGTALFAVTLAMVLAAGCALTHWTGMRIDADMRSRTVAQAWVAAKAIGLDNVRELTGTAKDLRSPDYARLKGQLASVRTADPAYRFVYLVGMRDDTCFFLADSEPPASEDYSPPGQTYEEASRTLLDVFAEGQAGAEGPVPDRWGTWVSALVPIKDPDSGQVLAVLGTDIDAATWAAAVARERLQPIAITALLVLIVLGAFAGYQHRLQHEAQLSARARELEASEARYRSVVTNMQDALYRTDADDMVVVASPSAASLFGYDRGDELLGLRASSFWMHPEKRSELVTYLNEHGSVSDHEVVLKRRDGSALLASANVHVLRAEDGEFLGYEGVFRDITERKRAEEALRESQESYRVISEGSPHGILMADSKTRQFVYANPCMCRLLGYTEKELLQLGVTDIHPKDSLGHVASEFESQARGEKTLASELPCLRKDGTVFYADVTAGPIILDGGQECLVGFFADVTERKQAEEERERMLLQQQGVSLLRQSLLAPAPLNDRLRSVTDSIVRLFNADFCRIWLIRAGDLCERDCMHAAVREGPHVCRRRDRCLHLLASSGRYTHTDGKAHRRVPFGCYKIGGIASREERRFITNDVVNDPRVHNHEWARELGLVSFVGYRLQVPGGEPLGVLALFAKQAVSAGEDAMLDGLSSTVALVVKQALAEEEVTQANTQLERLNAQLEKNARVLDHASTHDSLTGLPNRQYFTAGVQEHCEQAASGKSASFTVMFLDLDQFKLVNDTLGHDAGDMLLPEVAARLRSCVRSEDMLARMGGDEFTVILRGRRSRSAIESVTARILDSISRPYEIKGHRLVIGASIGLAMCPADGTDVTTLLRRADAAMYNAKQAGRGTFRWYAGVTDADDLMRLDLEQHLRSALLENELRVYYQPIISLRDGSLHGAEALLRWEHPQGRMVSPSVFIPIAEETGLIISIGDYVLRTACAQAKAWVDEGMPLFVIGVNVSVAQTHDDTWLDRVKAALSDTGLDAERLSLELTETAFSPDPAPLVPLLRKIRELGVGISIDDFGMGYSSLSRVKDLPISHLKIDGVFVRGIEDGGNEKALLASIIEMAHDLGITAIAEWVETQGQMDVLRSSGCDLAQGYFFSPPLPADQFRSFALGRTAPIGRKRRPAAVRHG
jgi:diguanylate cyclase (GGDEF)-like protein/PAS domain S-box-containing protein